MGLKFNPYVQELQRYMELNGYDLTKYGGDDGKFGKGTLLFMKKVIDDAVKYSGGKTTVQIEQKKDKDDNKAEFEKTGIPKTRHFSLHEYNLKAKGTRTLEKYYPVLQELFLVCEIIRERAGNRVVYMDSTFRSEAYQNKLYGYVKPSMHCYAGAVDIRISGLNRVQIAKICYQLYKEGVISGFGYGVDTIHIDIRHRTDLVKYHNKRGIWCYDKDPKTGKKFTSFEKWLKYVE